MIARPVALCVWLLGQSAPAPAAELIEPGPDWLAWSSSDTAGGCGDPSGFAAQVESRLGRAPALAAADLNLSIIVRVDRLPGPPPHWSGEIRVHTRDGAPDGVRTIARADDSCQQLTATLALMAALVLQSSGRGAAASPAAVEKSAPPNRIQADDPGPPGPQESVIAVEGDPMSRRWTISVALGPALDVGLLPGLGLAGEAAVALRHDGGGALFVAGSLSREANAFVNASQGASLKRQAVEVAGCWPDLVWGSRAVGLCGGAELARLQAVGFGFDRPASQERWSIGVTAGVQLRQRLAGPLYAAVGAELLIPLERNRIVYTDPSGAVAPIFTTAPVAGSARILIGISFR
jgi:hypothetical protein